MVGYFDHPAGTMYTCDDEYPDTLHGGRANQDGRLFYSVEARCGFLKCPPYVERRELVCAVCFKEKILLNHEPPVKPWDIRETFLL